MRSPKFHMHVGTSGSGMLLNTLLWNQLPVVVSLPVALLLATRFVPDRCCDSFGAPVHCGWPQFPQTGKVPCMLLLALCLVAAVPHLAFDNRILDGVEYFAGDRSVTKGPILYIVSGFETQCPRMSCFVVVYNHICMAHKL